MIKLTIRQVARELRRLGVNNATFKVEATVVRFEGITSGLDADWLRLLERVLGPKANVGVWAELVPPEKPGEQPRAILKLEAYLQ